MFIGGVLIGVLLPVVWQWIDEWPIPGGAVLRAVMSMEFAAVAFLRPVALGVAAAVALWIWTATQPRLHVSDEQIVVERSDQKRTIPREKVAGVYLDGATVVIGSVDGRTLFAAEVEGAKRLASLAFRRHGYPWESQ